MEVGIAARMLLFEMDKKEFDPLLRTSLLLIDFQGFVGLLP